MPKTEWRNTDQASHGKRLSSGLGASRFTKIRQMLQLHYPTSQAERWQRQARGETVHSQTELQGEAKSNAPSVFRAVTHGKLAGSWLELFVLGSAERDP